MRGPINYIGGKNRLAATIIALFPDHIAYVEPFAGGAQVFFRKEPSAIEVLNDLDGEIINFYRVCQSHHQELIRYMHFTVASRQLFARLRAADPTTLTDIQRAARFLYLQKNAFGGHVVKPHFHYGVTHNTSFDPGRIPELIEAAHRRLARTQIESLPYDRILAKYDRPTTLFYLDPPYWERKLYRFNFKEQDFIALEHRLRGLKGRLILSLDDHPKVRRLFKSFHIARKEVPYSARQGSGARYGELLITNF